MKAASQPGRELIQRGNEGFDREDDPEKRRRAWTERVNEGGEQNGARDYMYEQSGLSLYAWLALKHPSQTPTEPRKGRGSTKHALPI